MRSAWDGADQLERFDECGGGQHPQLDAFDLGEIAHGVLGVHAARSKVRAPADYGAAGALLHDAAQPLADTAVERLEQMRVAVERVAKVEHAELRRDRGPDRRSRQHHVDGADLHLLHHIGFLAELAVGKILQLDLGSGHAAHIRSEALIPDEVSRVRIGRER